MITHVAQAGEQRGRVVLWLGASSDPGQTAVGAAIHVARAFEAEIESLFIEDERVFALSGLPFVREISHTGAVLQPMSPVAIETHFVDLSKSAHGKVAAAARQARIPCRYSVVRDEPIAAIATACAENGPWNVVARAEPFSVKDANTLTQFFETVSASTGIVIAAPDARLADGSIVALIETLDRAEPMLRTAERLAREGHRPIVLLAVGSNETEACFLEGQMRLALEPDPRVTIASFHAPAGASKLMARRLLAHAPGFVITVFGGRIAPAGAPFGTLAARLACPVLLVR